jgi:glutamate-1-semialdehyde 2,1-aminomutase
VPAGTAAAPAVLPLADEAAFRAFMQARGAEVAAVIIEPVPANAGLLVQELAFLRALREETYRAGALLIFDEVITGFRLGPGGATTLYGIRPDLVTFGKVIGGGLPVGAYGGRADLMALVAPEGKVYQAGTLAGNPVAMAAGLATLRVLTRRGAFARLARRTAALAAALEAAARSRGVACVVPHAGGMLGLWFAARAPADLAEAKATDTARFKRYHAEMLARGVHLPPSPYEAWFTSLAHDDAVLRRILRAHAASLDATS